MGSDVPTLEHDEQCEVLIVGAGITGALVAESLTGAGVDVAVIDKREPGYGSTAVSTAILLYETDVELEELSRMVGTDTAVRSWHLGRNAVTEISELASRALQQDNVDVGFSQSDSLYLCSVGRHERRLRREVTTRQQHGFDANWLTAQELEHRFGIHAHGAIHSTGGGKADALRLTRWLLDRSQRAGARVYRGAELVAIESTPRGWRVQTSTGRFIRTSWIVVATGYETPELFPLDLVKLRSTFAIATERERSDAEIADPLAGVVAWESARPYAYLRSTTDDRIMIGGRDRNFSNAAIRDRLLPSQIPHLERHLRALLPKVSRETAFGWSGTFGETKDSLPCIGESPQWPRVLFALGYGGNGITFSAIASRIITDICRGRPNEDAALFRLDR